MSFGDIIKLRHLKYIIKMTSQKFSIFKSPLSEILDAPLGLIGRNTIVLPCSVKVLSHYDVF